VFLYFLYLSSTVQDISIYIFASLSTKPATVETGAEVNVPLFINEGDKIKIETAKGTYQERIKE